MKVRSSICEKLGQDGQVRANNESLESQDLTIEEPALPDSMNYEPVNEVERIIRLSQTMESIPDEGVVAKSLLQNIESNLIRVALDQSKGNVSKAAKLLNLGRTTLIQKISKK